MGKHAVHMFTDVALGLKEQDSRPLCRVRRYFIIGGYWRDVTCKRCLALKGRRR